MFAMQAQEETSRGVEVYLAVTLLYFVSAFAVNRLAALDRAARPGARHDRARSDGPMNLDFGFFNWASSRASSSRAALLGAADARSR
jgi:hypothetical protein